MYHSPSAKQAWKNVENSYKIKMGDDYERVLEVMKKKPFYSSNDSLLVNKIIDPFYFKKYSNLYLDIFYETPYDAESSIRISFDTNFVVVNVGYYY
jgi:hypothetical protein